MTKDTSSQKNEGITLNQDGTLTVPENPQLVFIEGDGIGPDIWRAAVKVFDSAVAKAYGGKRQVQWQEGLAGEIAFAETGQWLPEKTLQLLREKAPYHSSGRWHSEFECYTQTGSRPLCLCATGPLLQGCSCSRSFSGKGGHGGFPRKY